MALHVFIARTCKAEAEDHNEFGRVTAYAARVERDAHTRSMTAFMGTPFRKKVFGRSFRLIAREYMLNSVHVVVFMRFLTRGQSEYVQFNERRHEERFAAQFESCIDMNELKSWVSEIARKPAVSTLPPPDATESEFLNPELALTGGSSELGVLETQEWVRCLSDRRYADRLGLLLKALEGIPLSPDAGPLWWDDKLGVGILYRYFPALQKLVVMAPVLERSPEALAALASGHKAILDLDDSVAQREVLLRHAQRSYPHYLLADDEAWYAVQRDAEANLALSHEEMAVLNSVRSREPAAPVFPLFVNGRAGSGKSTILQYLMCDYLGFTLSRTLHASGPLPIYMTCSRELLDRARDHVRRLLLHNADSILGHATHDMSADTWGARVAGAVSNSFQVFHSFIYELLPSSEKLRFPREKRVTYARFRRLWDSQFKGPARRSLPLDLAWHGIRTYIKGMEFSADEPFDKDSYTELHQKQRSLTRETFDRIHDQVYQAWYMKLCNDHAYWDDQDLAAQVLRQDLVTPSYAAIFCDEAQDFTRIELDILFRLSLFSRRSVHPHEVRNIPFAFAGDPLQTLNPTGFRWHSVKADFHDKVVRALDSTGLSKLVFNYRELRNNYRSSKSIVRFCNLVLMVRCALFLDKEAGSGVEPQDWWDTAEDPPLPVYFSVEDPSIARRLKDQPDLVVIVNCEEGEERDWVEADAFLREVTHRDEDGVARNVFSPMRAKGLEFSRVLLYKFGESAPDRVTRAFESGTVEGTEADLHLPLEYFLNRLYVAASRPKRRLFIVDTPRALDGFWRFARSMDHAEKLWAGVDPKQRERWERAVCYLRQGTDQSWSGEQDDPGRMAELLMEQGRREGDPFFLRQARMLFASIGRMAESGLALAEAFRLEGRLSEAGIEYNKLGRREQAAECFWEAADFVAMSRLGQVFQDTDKSLRHRASVFMVGEHGSTEAQHLLVTVGDWLTDGQAADATRTDSTWRDVLSALPAALVGLPASEDRGQAAACLLRLAGQGLLSESIEMAQVAFRGGRLEDAVRIWEKLSPDRPNDKDYVRAKARLSPFPENLKWLDELGEQSEILDLWEAHGATPGQRDDTLVTVATAYERAGHKQEALAILSELPKEERLFALARRLLDCGGPILDETLASIVICALWHRARSGHWQDACDLVDESRSFPDGISNVLAAASDRLGVLAHIEDALVACVATFGVSTSKDRAALSIRLSKILGDPSGWKEAWKRVGGAVAGAAVEKISTKHVEKLSFYEMVRDHTDEEDERRAAQVRIIKCRQKKLELLEPEKRQEDQRRLYEEKVAVQGWRDPDAQIPDEPSPDVTRWRPRLRRRTTTRLGAPHTDVIAWTKGPLKLQLSRTKMRLKIDHERDFDNAMLDLRSREDPRGGGEFRRVQDLPRERSWRSETWKTRIRVRERPPVLRLTVEIDGEARDMDLPMEEEA